MKNMKKFMAALLVLTMVVALASTAFAYKEKAIDYKVKFTGTAYGYTKVDNQVGKKANRSSVAIRKGSVLWAAGKKGNWYKIWLPGRVDGEFEALWFCGDYLKADVDDDWKLVYSSGGSGRSGVTSATKSLAGYKKVTVKSGRRTNIRKSASLAGKSQGVIGKGHSIKTVKLSPRKIAQQDDRGVWFYEIIYKGKTLWVSSEYTKLKK